MSYRCTICNAVSPPNTPRKVHVVYRLVPCLGIGSRGETTTIHRKEIEKELSVCGQCKDTLDKGVDPDTLREIKSLQSVPVTKTVLAAPARAVQLG